MKSRDVVSRLKRFEVDEKRRKVAEIEAMIGDFHQMAVDLDRQIAIEQERAGVSDTSHYAYPTFAKAAIQRRDNLLASAADLEAKLANARAAFDEATEELKKIELMEERDAERTKLEAARAADLAPIAVGMQHRVAS
jgi:flagellar export protein FliJ